jgi:hypothetical protein
MYYLFLIKSSFQALNPVLQVMEIYTYSNNFLPHKNTLLVKTKEEASKETLWPLVCKRTIPTDRPPLVQA